MAYSQAEILDTDDKTIGALAIGLVFIVATAGLIGFVAQNTTIFETGNITQFIIQSFILFGFLFVLAIFANYKGLDFIQDYAYPIIKWSYIISITLLVGGLILFGLFAGPFGIIMIIIGIVIAALFYRGWPFIHEKIKLAAEWLKVSATIVLNEPGMIVLSFIQSIIIGITAIVEIITIFGWQVYAEAEALDDNTVKAVMYSIMFLYLWLSLSVIYYFDGANTFIAYARIHNKDPKVGQGLNAASNQILAIVGYALVSAIVTAITRMMFFASRDMRSEKNIGAQIMSTIIRWIAIIVEWLYHMVSFFTLPSIIIRQKNTKEAMSESMDLFTRTFWDKIIGDMGYGYGANILYIVTGLIVGVAGFAYGYFVASIYLTAGQLTIGIIIAIIALIFGMLVSRFFLKPLYTALVTTMYVYATEGGDALKIVPSSLANHIERQSSNPKYLRSTSSKRMF